MNTKLSVLLIGSFVVVLLIATTTLLAVNLSRGNIGGAVLNGVCIAVQAAVGVLQLGIWRRLS